MFYSFLKFQPINTQISNFWSQFWAFLLLHEIFQSNKFERIDFNFDSITFKFQIKNSQFGPGYNHFQFCTKREDVNFAFGEVSSKFQSKNIHFYSFFPFCMKLYILKNSGVLISKMTMVSLKLQSKNTQLRHFL